MGYVCSHCPINDYILPLTLHLCYKPLGILKRVTKSQRVHISIHDGLQKLLNISLALHRSHGFPLYIKLFKQLAYLSLTGISIYRRGITPPPPPLHILFLLFGIPILIYSCLSSHVICETLRLWYSG